MQIYVLFIAVSWIKTYAIKIHKVCKLYKIYEADIINNLQCFDNTFIISRLGSCQLLVSVFWVMH